MLTASIVCPHCGKSDLATFGEIHEFGAKDMADEGTVDRISAIQKSPSETIKPGRGLTSNKSSDPLYVAPLSCVALIFCQHCFNPIMAILGLSRIELANHTLYLKNVGVSVKNSRLTMDRLTLFPEPTSVQAHPSWPEKVRRLVPDIDRMIQQRFDPSIPISTSRTVIDICTKDLGGEGRNIFERINDLLSKGVITKPIADWAHKVRLLGADATHDADGTDQEVLELANFIHFFLKAAYELSADVAKESNPNAAI